MSVLIEGRARDLGGFQVMRILPDRRRRNVGPFVFLDHMGPARGADVRPHPHIGLATVTYLFDGEITHRDSLGYVQQITPGAINLMTAGRGIVHSERTHADSLHGVQIWLALPLEHEQGEPGFAHHPADSLPAWRADGIGRRLLLGATESYRSPVAAPGAPFLLDLQLDAGACLDLPDLPELAVYVIDGELRALDATVAAKHLLVRDPDTTLSITATTSTRALVLGGAPLDAPRHLDWNFVASSRDLLAHARDAWRARTFPTIPGDDLEFVPYPEVGPTW